MLKNKDQGNIPEKVEGPAGDSYYDPKTTEGREAKAYREELEDAGWSGPSRYEGEP